MHQRRGSILCSSASAGQAGPSGVCPEIASVPWVSRERGGAAERGGVILTQEARERPQRPGAIRGNRPAACGPLWPEPTQLCSGPPPTGEPASRTGQAPLVTAGSHPHSGCATTGRPTLQMKKVSFKEGHQDFPGGSGVKSPPAIAKD